MNHINIISKVPEKANYRIHLKYLRFFQEFPSFQGVKILQLILHNHPRIYLKSVNLIKHEHFWAVPDAVDFLSN